MELNEDFMKKNLSILIYSLGSGGAERVVSLLLEFLKEYFNVTLVLMNNTIHYEVPKNIQVFYLEESSIYESGILKLLKIPFLAYRYRKLCTQYNIDTSLSFMNRPNYINVIAKLLGNKCHTIISERAMPSLQYGYNNFQSKINKILIKSLYPEADKIIANSYGNAEDLERNFSIQKSLLHVIQNPIDLTMIQQNALEPINFNFNPYTYITIGRLDEGKNHAMLIHAFAKLANKSTQLLIIGDGLLKEPLQKQIDSLNLQNRVFLLGKKTNPYKYLQRSDCFVFGSNHEGFPNVVLEALATNLPVISTNCPSGPQEILAPTNKNEYGILTPVNNSNEMYQAMQLLLTDNNKANYYKNQARIRAKDFDKTEILQHYLKVINE